MPNIASMEPQILIDLLALNLYTTKLGIPLPGEPRISLISPWITNVELGLRPTNWHSQISRSPLESTVNLLHVLEQFLELNWSVDVAVLKYGQSANLYKNGAQFEPEKALLRELAHAGSRIFFLNNLHGKGIVTPMGALTGSTNITNSGLYLQVQNANYFSYVDPNYAENAAQLRSTYGGATAHGPRTIEAQLAIT